jgi:hypothetical protein
MSKILQTTIAGSLPKPTWLATPGQLWAPWLLEGDALAEGMQDAVRLALRDQEEAGIDIVTDGEQTRRHFVPTFPSSSARWRAGSPCSSTPPASCAARPTARSSSRCPAR